MSATKKGTAMTPLALFKLLADDTRLRALLLVHQQGELCVCELMCALDESQPKISRHLAQLRKANLLLDRRQGQWVYYRLNPALPSWVADLFSMTLENNSAFVAPNIQNLCAMGNRPERAKACC